MKNKSLLFFLCAASALALFGLTGCNIVRIDVPAGTTIHPGGITIEQSAYKAAAGQGTTTATTTPTTDANLGLR